MIIALREGESMLLMQNRSGFLLPLKIWKLCANESLTCCRPRAPAHLSVRLPAAQTFSRYLQQDPRLATHRYVAI
jgi:hypothetical protein